MDITLPNEALVGKLRDQLPAYGFENFNQLFTQRQLLVLFTLIKHIRLVYGEIIASGVPEDRALALVTYLAMAFGRVVVAFNKFTRWEPRIKRTMGALGDRQALKMVYDFSEINPFAHTQGCLSFALEREAFCIRELATVGSASIVKRGSASRLDFPDEMFDAIITDPPYYSSIFYADLSAFYYVWLKRLIGDLYPEHFALAVPPKKREAVAQASEHGGDAEKADRHYQGLMRAAFAEAKRVLKKGAPLVCVYAHRSTQGWATLINALVDAGMTVTEAWPVQTESRSRVNAKGAAALSDSIFFVARRRERSDTGRYETDVGPELHSIARERVETLWADGKGIGGADLLMAAVGAGLRAYTRFARVEYANGEAVRVETYLREVEGVVLEVILANVFGLQASAVGAIDSLTRFYILWRYTYRESHVAAGEAYVFCYPQGIELDGPDGICGPIPSLVEKIGTKFRVRTHEERGNDSRLGIREDQAFVPIIDVLHRLLWLLDNRPGKVHEFLDLAHPNIERLRLVVQALSKPVLDHADVHDTAVTAELAALARLNANWQSILDSAAHARGVKSRLTGQQEISFGGEQQ